MGKQVTELDALPSFTDNSLLPVHNGAGLKKGLLSQLANYLGTKFSNPNLLINPDFKINQRGATSYEKRDYSVDRWKIWSITATPNDDGSITVKNDKYKENGYFRQYLENAVEGDVTLSCYVTSVSGTVAMVADNNKQVTLQQGLNVLHISNGIKIFGFLLSIGTSITLKWAKLEQSKVATAYIAPNPTEELVKCRRYYNSMVLHLYGASNPEGFINEDLFTFRNFRINPTFNINSTYSVGITQSTLVMKGSNNNGYYLYGRTSSSGAYALDVTVTADAEIY